jgi:hypothetical protein
VIQQLINHADASKALLTRQRRFGRNHVGQRFSPAARASALTDRLLIRDAATARARPTRVSISCICRMVRQCATAAPIARAEALLLRWNEPLARRSWPPDISIPTRREHPATSCASGALGDAPGMQCSFAHGATLGSRGPRGRGERLVSARSLSERLSEDGRRPRCASSNLPARRARARAHRAACFVRRRPGTRRRCSRR